MSIPGDFWTDPRDAREPAAARPAQRTEAQAGGETGAQDRQGGFLDFMFGKDGFDGWDLLDVINPLQHIPLINTVYRKLTGDEIGQGARLAGSALYGGVPGLLSAGTDLALTRATGKDTGMHVASLLTGDDDTRADRTDAVRQATADPVPDRGFRVAASVGATYPWRHPAAAGHGVTLGEVLPDPPADPARKQDAGADRRAVSPVPDPIRWPAGPPPVSPSGRAESVTSRNDPAPPGPAEWHPAAMAAKLDTARAGSDARDGGDTDPGDARPPVSRPVLGDWFDATMIGVLERYRRTRDTPVSATVPHISATDRIRDAETRRSP